MRAEAQARLDALVEQVVQEDAAAVLAEARAAAREEVRMILTDAITRALLDRIGRPAPLAAPAEETSHGADRRPVATGEPLSGDRLAGAVAAPPPARSGPTDPVGPPDPVDAGDAATAVGVACYVYGIVAAGDAEAAESLPGVDPDHPVIAVTEGNLAAIVSQVPLSEFGEEEMRARLADLAWVERVARRHEDVLDELLHATTVIPMRMCTLLRDPQSVTEMLHRERDRLEESLETLRGKHEWGVKAFLHMPPRSASESSVSEEMISGAEYMARRRAERDREQDAEQRAAEAAERVHEALGALAAEACLNAPHRPEVSGHPGTMVLNAAYLVPHSVLESFHTEVDRLGDEYAPLGLELVETGPWPPYNFLPGQIGATW